jgi:glycosyltransferase involved in cell wall biosynthesis
VKTDLPLIYVLLATFNGAKHLNLQLQSIADQNHVCVKVIANDDGSSDDTMKILEKWKESGLIEKISTSDRKGPTSAFLALLKESSEFEFVAFSDQDDIWVQDKLWKQFLRITDSFPTLVFSSRQYIDQDGKSIGASKKLQKLPSFRNAMVENIAPGNTLMLNNSAINLVNRISAVNVFHYDAWIYLLLSAFGKISYIDEQLVNYRIHSNNHVGLRKKSLTEAINSINIYMQQMFELRLNIDEQTSPKVAQDIDLFLGIKSHHTNKINYRKLFFVPISRQSKIDALVFRFLLLFALKRNCE